MKHWLTSFRLRTLPLSLSSTILGGFLATSNGCFQWGVFLLAVLTTVFLQILSNIANDYGDFIHGADIISTRKGPKRMVSDGKITKEAMKRAIVILSILSFTTGILLLWRAGIFGDQIKLSVFLSLGILAIAAAIFYTNGKRPYGYAGLGDISVFLFFGIVGVEGSYFLMCGKFGLDILLPAATCGFFSVGVLNINNIRDMESDKLAGKYSIPVRIGLNKARIYHLFLLCSGVICALCFTLLNFRSPKQLFFMLSFAPLFIHAQKSYTLTTDKFDPLLKQLSLTTLFFCITFGLGLIF